MAAHTELQRSLLAFLVEQGNNIPLPSRADVLLRQIIERYPEVAVVASALDPQSREVKLLAQNVERAKRTALKANKKLAKEVTKWVATAVEGAGDAGSSTMSASEGGANETDCPQS